MKKVLAYGIIIVALTISYVVYHKQITVPKKLISFYDDCKAEAFINNQMGWLRQCDNQKPLSKECKTLLASGFPWDLYRAIKNGDWEITEEDHKKYTDYLQKMDECQCKTLPTYAAAPLNKDLKSAEDKCLSELEVMTKVLQ